MQRIHRVRQLVSAGLLVIVFIAGIFVLLSTQMNNMVHDTTLNTVNEIAAHDQLSIESFLDRSWSELEHIYGRLVTYDCATIADLQERMSLERSTSGFHTLYLVAEDGTVYNDRYSTYNKDEMDIRSYLPDGQKRIACRFDYHSLSAGQKEMLLYAVAVDDFQVEGVRISHLAGICPINQIQDHMAIYSFYKDGESRGYTSVINPNGDYIVNTRRTVSVNQRENLYEILNRGTRDDAWTDEAIRESMVARETFQVTYVDEEGISRFLFFMPVDGVSWYLVSAVEQSVFTDLSRTFTLSSISMVVIAVMASACMLFLVLRSRKNAQAANALAKARSDFLSNMSHEIRTPLNGITGLLHLMQTHLVDGNREQMLEWIQKASDTAHYLLSLISDILDVSKLQAGKLTLNNAPFLLDAMLDAIESMQRENIAGRGVELILEKHIVAPCVIGDETRVKQVLMNIVGNAAKFTPGGGTIRLSAEQVPEADGWVITTIRCADTGIGMTPEFQKTIWDSFTQEHNKVSDGTRGTGLGMAISKGIMDAMGGSISVESELGKGSTFTVAFRSEIGEMEEVEELPAPEAAASVPMKLLVAEDNELNAEILMEILSDSGYEAVLAKDGRQAVEQFEQSAANEFDAILMDLQMPVMDGCQAALAIRALDRPDAGEIPIFACTANSFQEDRNRALASGMNDFLTKPIDIGELLGKLALERKRKAEG